MPQFGVVQTGNGLTVPETGYSTTMSTPRLRSTWLLRRHEALILGCVYALLTAIWFVVGYLLTHVLKNSAIVRADQSISEWFVKQRTPGLNSLSFIGSMLSDTVVKIVVTAVVAVVMLIAWKRWLEPLMVVVALILEALCFITITTLVARPRPDVPRLDSSPVGSSFPSGHTGAAVAYSAIVVVVFWHTRRRWIRALAVAVGVIVPVLVGLARLYRGMHFFTDVIFGALLGGASVIATAIVLGRAGKDQAVGSGNQLRPEPELASVGAIEQ
jgi:undecaprenyl-diphosphatase